MRAQLMRAAVAMTTVAATVFSLGQGLAAAADPPPLQLRQSDRATVLMLWRVGGTAVRAGAERSLLGSDADIHSFLTTGLSAAEVSDRRDSVLRMRDTGGPALKAAATQAVNGGDTAIIAFLDDGWETAWTVDKRLQVNQIMATGGSEVRKAAQLALDLGTVDSYEGFIETGWQLPDKIDRRIRVNQIMATGGPSVREFAQRALDVGTPEAFELFFERDLPLGQARDQERATIAELAGIAKDAGELAAKEVKAANDAALRAVQESLLAKQSAEIAAQAAQSAQGNATEAAAAAGRAAEAANKAADAAREAISAANTASAAAKVAAGAASRAATAATMAGRAASDAYNAAAAVTLDAGKVNQAGEAAARAKQAAVAARDVAAAANAAGVAAQNANTAVASAKDATVHTNQAAAAAMAAYDWAKRAGVDVTAARVAAANAQAAATRATRAANAAQTFAAASAVAAFEARDAANRAAADADLAAAAAIEAAKHAGNSQNAAAEATAHANAATQAAGVAADAAARAVQVYEAARVAEAERLAVQSDDANAAAIAMAEAVRTHQVARKWDASQAAQRDAETQRLIAEATAPGAPQVEVVAKGRRVALALLSGSGQWTRAAAENALSGSDLVVVSFITTGLNVAAGQDDRVTLRSLGNTASPNFKTVIDTALAGTDADVKRVLDNPDYPGRDTEDRLKVNQVMAAAQQAGNTVLAQTAQKALDTRTGTAYREFLSDRQYPAVRTDERLRTNRIYAAVTSGPELKAAAQAALHGPSSMAHEFLETSQFAAAQRDQEADRHKSETLGLIAQAARSAATAAEDAAKAQNLAAVARGAAQEAAGYAQQALDAAGRAATHAQEARNSAIQAEGWATKAAISAETARGAADRARNSAREANRSAQWASASASQASEFAAKAYADFKRAEALAIQAGKTADKAIEDGNAAVSAYLTEAEEERKFQQGSRIASCAEDYPTNSSLFRNCVNLVTSSMADLSKLAYQNALLCEPLKQTNAYENCVADVLSPEFSANRMLDFAEPFVAYMQAFASGLAFTNGMFAGLLLCGPICNQLMLAAMPDGTAFLPVIAPALASAWIVTFRNENLIRLSHISTRFKLFDAQLVQQKLNDAVKKLRGKEPSFQIEHIALGHVDADLAGFATSIGAEVLRGSWREDVVMMAEMMRLAPGSFKISVSLNGVPRAEQGVKPAVDYALEREIAREMGKPIPGGPGGGMTEWELRQFEKRGLLKYLDFYYGAHGGPPLLNPYK
jgi:hypothetical protein